VPREFHRSAPSNRGDHQATRAAPSGEVRCIDSDVAFAEAPHDRGLLFSRERARHKAKRSTNDKAVELSVLSMTDSVRDYLQLPFVPWYAPRRAGSTAAYPCAHCPPHRRVLMAYATMIGCALRFC
jgi:hypothetical protein